MEEEVSAIAGTSRPAKGRPPPSPEPFHPSQRTSAQRKWGSGARGVGKEHGGRSRASSTLPRVSVGCGSCISKGGPLRKASLGVCQAGRHQKGRRVSHAQRDVPMELSCAVPCASQDAPDSRRSVHLHGIAATILAGGLRVWVGSRSLKISCVAISRGEERGHI